MIKDYQRRGSLAKQGADPSQHDRALLNKESVNYCSWVGACYSLIRQECMGGLNNKVARVDKSAEAARENLRSSAKGWAEVVTMAVLEQ